MSARAKLGLGLLFALPAVSVAAATRLPGQVELGSPDFASSRATAREPQAAGGKSYRRLASASLLTDELLLELAPERLVSVSYVADDASVTPVARRFSRSIPRVNGSAEQLLFVRADLVLFSDYNGAATSSALESAGSAVLRVGAATTFAGLLEEIRRLGRVIAEPERTRALAAQIEAKLARLEQNAQSPRRRVLLLHSSYAYAAGTLQNDCLTRSGLENALARLNLQGTPGLSGEALLAADPDAIFLAWDVEQPRRLEPAEWPSGYPWQLVRAARGAQIYAVPQALMASISHHALGACEAYSRLARGGP